MEDNRVVRLQGFISPFASGYLSSPAEAQDSRASAHPPDRSPLQSYIAPGGSSDFRRRYPLALRFPDSLTTEAVRVSSNLCLRVLTPPKECPSLSRQAALLGFLAS